MILMEGRNLFCAAYFSLLSQVKLRDYLCPAVGCNTYARLFFQFNVDLIIVGCGIKVGDYGTNKCDFSYPRYYSGTYKIQGG